VALIPIQVGTLYTFEEICKIIQKFSNTKAPEKDNISAKLLKEINEHATTP